MTSTASSILDYASNPATKGVRRWGSKTQTPPSKVSTSSLERTTTARSRSTYTMTTAGSTPCAGLTTFLPELHSTPPMPTFQKPVMGTPTPLRRERYGENVTPSRTSLPRRPDTPFDEPSMSNLSHRPSRPRLPYTTMPPVDRMGETPPLPKGWSRQQDRAICILDASDYSLPAIVQKIRRVFPELNGTLTTAMVDKRLRQLDQIVELDYWAIGLAKTEKQQRNDKAKVAGAEKRRLNSGNTLLPSGKAGAQQGDTGSKTPASTRKQRAQSLGNADGASTSSHSTSRNLATRGFLNGLRSQLL